MCSVLGGEIKWDSFWKEWDSSKSLHNCILVRVLIISSSKWEMLRTGESVTNFILWSPEVGYTDPPCWVLSTLNLSSPFLLFPVVKMNMVVSSQLSSITELNLALLTAQTTGCRQVILSLLCSCGSNVTKSLGQGRSFISAQGWGHWSSKVL